VPYHTQKIIGEYHERYPYIQLMHNEKRFVPFALNLGIGRARGEVIIRMDAHSAYPKNYISALVEHLFFLQADNVGGVWDTRPANNSAKANSIAVALSSSFGVGNSHYRLGVGEIRRVDTVPYGCFHKTLFDRIGLFDNELLRNQDDEFNARIIENGGSIYLIPNVTITYYARPDIASLTKMFYQYAFFKPLVNRKLKKPATVRQFVPPLFLLFLLAGWIGGIITPTLLYFYFGGVGLYLLFNLLFTIKSTVHNRKLYLMAYLPWIFLLQHLSYGLGYLAGTLNFTFSIRKIQSISNSR
jgi:glycosyltransferase involved in cell wall biosynthesis